MRLEANSGRFKELCIRWGSRPIPAPPIISIGSLCCGVRSKRDHSIINNGTTCDASFRQNSSLFVGIIVIIIIIIIIIVVVVVVVVVASVRRRLRHH